MSADPFGRALRDHYQGVRTEPLIQRDGMETLEHPIEEFYFGNRTDVEDSWIDSWLEGPLLDFGAGVGRDTLYYQEQFETVAIEASEPLVETMRDRGVTDARFGDMFNLRDAFDQNRFQSALARGTQLGLTRSMRGIQRFLDDLAFVTKPDATAVLDSYDPTVKETADLPGYREDTAPGLAFRVMHFEYESEVGPTLLFRLFSPDRLRETVDQTAWEFQRSSGVRVKTRPTTDVPSLNRDSVHGLSKPSPRIPICVSLGLPSRRRGFLTLPTIRGITPTLVQLLLPLTVRDRGTRIPGCQRA